MGGKKEMKKKKKKRRGKRVMCREKAEREIA
jgi:hypothetical protein